MSGDEVRMFVFGGRCSRCVASVEEAAGLLRKGVLRIGVQLPEVERNVRWPEMRAMARTAEDSGYHSIWLGDHMLYRGDGRPERGPWDAWTMLAALASSTERVELGPLVASTAFHPPGLVARMAATIDEVSGGRFILGLGTGWNETEFRAFGIPFEHKVARFEEAFTIIRGLLAGERVTFAGRFYQADDAVLLPTPTRRVPLLVGTSGPRVLALSAPHVHYWNAWYAWYGNTPSGFEQLSSRLKGNFRRSACVLVNVDGGGERPSDPTSPPVNASSLRDHIDELHAVGADEVVLILDPITQRSILTVAEALELDARQ
jgi:alkanesulfonate monooxygenase SsuD/methylene tetrahydromethanopterin reductase-like flavin-dependent oxidoreductase (luciferase family)